MERKMITAEDFKAAMDKIDQRFEHIDQRFDLIEKHMVTNSNVHIAVFQGLAFAAAAIVGTVVVLNSVGAL